MCFSDGRSLDRRILDRRRIRKAEGGDSAHKHLTAKALGTDGIPRQFFSGANYRLHLDFSHHCVSSAIIAASCPPSAQVFSSIVSFCWETVPSGEVREMEPTASLNATETEGRTIWNPFFWLELVCIIWFTIGSFRLRLISVSPYTRKKTLFQSWLFDLLVPHRRLRSWLRFSTSSTSLQ